MWLNEHRRGPGWTRFLSAGRQRRFLLDHLPKRGGREVPRAERLLPGRCLSWSLLGVLVCSAGRHGGSGTRGLGLQGPASPVARRASAAAGAAPREPPPRTVLLARAGGGGGGGGPLKSTAGPPDPPAAAPRWSRLDCGKGASRRRRWLRPLDPGAPNSSVSVRSKEDPFSRSVHA